MQDSSRRHFLKGSLALGALAALPAWARPAPDEARRLRFIHLHTGEQVSATYWADGNYQPDELAVIHRLLRDHRSGEIAVIDCNLLEILHALQQQTGAHRAYEVISGFRSPATNRALRRATTGVAKDSLHTHGRAIDVRLPGLALADLRRAAIALRAGGVGYYPDSQFVHLDTGRVRHW